MNPIITINLDSERRISFTNLARYRMGTLDRAFSLDDLSNPRKSYAALVAWIWACLVPEDARDFASPEALVLHMPLDGTGSAMKALGEAVKAAGDQEKNGSGSKPKRSRSSS